MQKELNSLMANGTWDLEKLPPRQKIVTYKWVFKVKKYTDGSVERLKAQLIAREFTQ